MELFQQEERPETEQDAPLAWRMRPKSLDEFEGQRHLLAHGKPLRRAIEEDRMASFIFYGPPGTGKTALAGLMAERTGAAFVALNAVTAGVVDIRKAARDAEEVKKLRQRKTILFVDEIHRFNKIQQDAMLPDLEKGKMILIGASTENPFFALIPALRSRSRILEFKPLLEEELMRILRRAMEDPVRGFGRIKIRMSEEALKHIVTLAEGDARKALNSLEIGVLSTLPVDGVIDFTLSVAEEAVQKKALLYDRDGDAHYDTASAFIKSMRGSDPDAAIYYLARMIEAGEDPRFMARRIVICASEDVGNADPRALLIAEAAQRAVERVGMPEARIILAQAVTYIATAPKSNASYMAVEQALSDVRSGETLPIPDFLRDSHYEGAGSLGRGKGYRYPHDEPGHFVPQNYLSVEKHYYHPTGEGYEQAIRERMNGWKKKKEAVKNDTNH
ncbi:MAG: AAA family ATPase [Nitrospirae bacterium CG_4_9_14_3_um_filter_53_35]|nr:MAG: AAA family ATPase [Nitrospirae bacterium CG2_30_53_67]PIS36370.1 MAG: AAA family ATPase [Nitrospirae bacterium CG08_land_8_20_14_0_20_52_24]PIV85540.1 MAG: AAA family ATPase [Nitrospirae bacterium CG17_big_fil_post_rev_8_21_14_2_50_50_9]PIW85312.1 MAG: AAA family ATPase [Nitrospirae bacterium CG_4_8_14_3_um_filter_50_41]PIX85020.1 MAG: AAA family ATPase [Nitrospirae bacterium CG_4_10_14_3_um_filter_53_41]PJA73132.1 MAG: AAA family ATPase [Nitrospirae bacterium CG_4_9_14_3_um_filter_53_